MYKATQKSWHNARTHAKSYMTRKSEKQWQANSTLKVQASAKDVEKFKPR
jgi:hypothetical protein